MVRVRRRRSHNSQPLPECVQHLDPAQPFVDIDVAAQFEIYAASGQVAGRITASMELRQAVVAATQFNGSAVA